MPHLLDMADTGAQGQHGLDQHAVAPRSPPPKLEIGEDRRRRGGSLCHPRAVTLRAERMERGVMDMGGGAVPVGHPGRMDPAPGRTGHPRFRAGGTVPAGRFGPDCALPGPDGAARARSCRRYPAAWRWWGMSGMASSTRQHPAVTTSTRAMRARLAGSSNAHSVGRILYRPPGQGPLHGERRSHGRSHRPVNRICARLLLRYIKSQRDSA